MTDGYLYCFSNESMPGLLKIGRTERSPDIRLKEANRSSTYGPPTEYKIEFAKRVSNHKQKETILHKLLEQYTERVNPNREFFRISIEEIKAFFELIDGELWIQNTKKEEEDENEEEETNDITKLGCREMKNCFKDGQRIRHTIGINKTWIGIYDLSKDGIMYDGNFYKSLSGFTRAHYIITRPDRTSRSNGWRECYCEVDGKWISTYNL